MRLLLPSDGESDVLWSPAACTLIGTPWPLSGRYIVAVCVRWSVSGDRVCLWPRLSFTLVNGAGMIGDGGGRRRGLPGTVLLCPVPVVFPRTSQSASGITHTPPRAPGCLPLLENTAAHCETPRNAEAFSPTSLWASRRAKNPH